MKRPIFRVAVFLLLGAIVNVAVAWAYRIHEYEAIQRVFRTRVNPTPSWCGHPDLRLEIAPLRSAPIQIDMRLPTRAGCPSSSFEAFMFGYDSGGRLVPVSGLWRTGIQVSPHVFGLTGQNISLPVRGFAINTIFYAVILWLLFAAPFALGRHLRIKRGLCPACAYPIGDNPVCTECGKPVKIKNVQQPGVAALMADKRPSRR